jgi:NADPH:quinone reductase-like Zn-dependent oxidoreductase
MTEEKAFMRQVELADFGLDQLSLVDAPTPEPAPGEVLIRMEAASLNPRDAQIAAGHFTPNVPFPLVPLSDGAGTVAALGEGVSELAVGDRVAPLFFPNWLRGEATAGERSVSLGLEWPGVAREYAAYPARAVARVPEHLSAVEAACYPCAGLTAWTSLVEKSAVGEGDWVLLQGTGGVASMGLQLAKGLGARAIVISSSDEKLSRARELGADHTINYRSNPEWGAEAFEVAGHGVDAVLEIGGAGTLPQSLEAIRHGGHIDIIGYMAGVEMGITVFPLIIRNANIHGIGAGHRESFEAMMRLVGQEQLRPAVAATFPLEDIGAAFEMLGSGSPFGKVVLSISGE